MKKYAKVFLNILSLALLISCCFQCNTSTTNSDSTDSVKSDNQNKESFVTEEDLSLYQINDDSLKRTSLDQLRAGAVWKQNKLYTICINATLTDPNYQHYRLLIEESNSGTTYPVAKIVAGPGTIQFSYLHRRPNFVPIFSIRIYNKNGGYHDGTISTTTDVVTDCGVDQAVTDKLQSASLQNSRVLVTIDEK